MDDPSFGAVMDEMESMHLMLAASVSPPLLVEKAGRLVFRYPHEGAREALLQKLACVVSGLNASMLLLSHGFVQEAGVQARVLDDLNDDVRLLSKSIIVGDPGSPDEDDAVGQGVVKAQAVVERFLKSFYADVVADRRDPVKSLLKKRTRVVRKDVRIASESFDAKMLEGAPAELTERVNQKVPVSSLIQAVGVLFNSYVHTGSPQIMETYGGSPPRYHVDGMLGTPLMEPHLLSFHERLVSCLLSFEIAGMALQVPEVLRCARELREKVSAIGEHDRSHVKSDH